MTALCHLTHPIVENTIAPGMAPADLICGRSPGTVLAFAVFVVVCTVFFVVGGAAVIVNLTRSTP
jgi:hypothetical protein